MISCVIGDDHSLVRELLHRALETSPNIRIVGEGSDAQEALHKAVALNADVLILDIQMPGFCSFQAAKLAIQARHRLKVLFLTGLEDDLHLDRAIEAGASGYVHKSVSILNLTEVIEKVHRGEKHFPAFDSAYSPSRLTGLARLNELTGREQQVLKLLAEGNTVKETAIVLDLAAKTVEVHKSHLMAKLNIHSKVQLVMFAIQVGVLMFDQAT